MSIISKVTPEELLSYTAFHSDVVDVDRVLGQFESTTGFLTALLAAMVTYEHSEPEIEAVRQFRQTFAKVEADSMNKIQDDQEPETVRQPVLSPRPERPLPLLRDPNVAQYSQIVDGRLINAGDVLDEPKPSTQQSGDPLPELKNFFVGILHLIDPSSNGCNHE